MNEFFEEKSKQFHIIENSLRAVWGDKSTAKLYFDIPQFFSGGKEGKNEGERPIQKTKMFVEWYIFEKSLCIMYKKIKFFFITNLIYLQMIKNGVSLQPLLM